MKKEKNGNCDDKKLMLEKYLVRHPNYFQPIIKNNLMMFNRC